jgi:hypothetical protein
MEASATDDGAVFEATAFLIHFNDLLNTRQPGKVVYPLHEVLLLALLAVLAGAETFTDIARFGPSAMEPRRMTGSAISSRRWTPTNFSAVSLHGSPRYRHSGRGGRNRR